MKVLVVGLGSAGKRHVENLTALGVEVLTCGHSWDYAAALARRPDAVVIATPTYLHVPYLRLAVAEGCHVYVEKPVAAVRPGSIVVGKCVVAVGNQLRFNDCLIRMKTALADRIIGRLLHVHVGMGEYLPAYHPGEDYRQGYAARFDLGGGVLLTQIHDINYLHWLFGAFQWVHAIGGKSSNLEIDVEDSVSFIAKTTTVPVTVHVDFLQRRPQRMLIVTGEHGTLTWDYHSNTLIHTDARGQRDIGPGVPLDRNGMFMWAMVNFLGCIRLKEQPATTFREGVMDVVVVDAIRESFTTEKPVTVNYERD